MAAARGRRWPLLLLLGGAGALIASRHLDVVEVRGLSMAPSLLPGERLLVGRVHRQPRVGDVVLAADPRDPARELVKRVVDVRGTEIALAGDNPGASTDSRAFGAVSAAGIQWRVLGRYWPPLRIGRVPAAHRGSWAGRLPLDEGGEAACAFPEALIAGG